MTLLVLFYTHDCIHLNIILLLFLFVFRHLISCYNSIAYFILTRYLMLVVKNPAYANSNRNYHKRNKVLKRYDYISTPARTNHNYDLRLIVLRHGERIDQTLGQKWYDQVFGGVPSAPAHAYKHPALPYRLPQRSNTLLYVFDPPITNAGEKQAFFKGQELVRVGATVDYCYSSPASRSVLTANAVLKGMNRSHIPIRIEPYLFEPLSWNSALLMLDRMYPFMSSRDWQTTGYNVDRNYHRLNNYILYNDAENEYYNRSLEFFDFIERHHGNVLSPNHRGLLPRRRKTILITGHAASTEMFSTIALRQPFEATSFKKQCGKVPYLHAAVLERDAITRIWYIRPVMYYT